MFYSTKFPIFKKCDCFDRIYFPYDDPEFGWRILTADEQGCQVQTEVPHLRAERHWGWEAGTWRGVRSRPFTHFLRSGLTRNFTLPSIKRIFFLAVVVVPSSPRAAWEFLCSFKGVWLVPRGPPSTAGKQKLRTARQKCTKSKWWEYL